MLGMKNISHTYWGAGSCIAQGLARLRRSRRRVKTGEPKVWFTSTESFAKVLSAGNRELLRIIVEKGPNCREGAELA
jgi:predicted transcriptional regulator